MTGRRVVVMAGPSLPPRVRGSVDGCEWHRPATAGDVAALLNDPPQVLCLIDGLFDSEPAPWHKELLMVMAAGTLVLGASSMGALRAAELDRHGMIGVGAIYRAYRQGVLTGDDEVALIHATGKLGWAPLSVPLVEVRATLVAACRLGLVSPKQARGLRSAAMAIHFSDRDWPALESRWVAQDHCDESTARALAAAHVPLKQQDALECIAQALRMPLGQGPRAEPPITYFVMQLLGRGAA